MLEARGRARGALEGNEVALVGNCWRNFISVGRFGSGNVPGNEFVINDKISSACKDFSLKKGFLYHQVLWTEESGMISCCRWFSGLFLHLSQ